MKTRFQKLLCTIAIFCSACGSKVPVAAPFPDTSVQDPTTAAITATSNSQTPSSDIVVKAGNRISVTSTLDSKILTSTTVPWDGVIQLPYNVEVKVGGLKLVDARAAVEEAYTHVFRGASHIKLRLDYRKVMARARGLVQKPGEYLVDFGCSVDELIAAAGGLTRPANGAAFPSIATITRTDGSKISARLDDYYSGQAEHVPLLDGGETVMFHDGATAQSNPLGVTPGRVRFLGQVKNPGEFQVRDSAHLMYYMVQAGGPTDRADMSGVQVWRMSEGKAYPFHVSGTESDAKFTLAAGDLVFVPSDTRTDIERAAGVVGGFGSFIGSIAAAAIVAK